MDDVAPAGRARAAAGPQLVEAYEAALPRRSSRTAGARWPLLATLARAPTRASWPIPRRPSPRNQTILEIGAQGPGGGRRRSSACTSRPGRFADLLAIYDKKLELAKTASREAGDPLQAGRPLRRGDPAARQGDRALSGDPRRRIPTQLPALAALDRLYQRPRVAGRICRPRCSAGDRSVDGPRRGRRAEVPARRGPRAASRTTARGAVALVPRGAGARLVARGRARPRCRPTSERRRELQMAAVEVLEPIYEQTQDICRAWSRSSASRLGHEKKTEQARRRCCCASASSRPARATPNRPGGATPRAFAREPGVGAARARRWRTWPTILDNWRPLVALYEKALSASESEAAAGARARAPAGGRGRVRREAGAVGEGRRVLPARAAASSPRTPRRWWRWSASTRAPSAGAIWSTRCTKKAQLGQRRAPSARQIRIRIATVWEEMLRQRRARRSSPGTSCWQDNPQQRAARCARSIACYLPAAATSASWPTTCSSQLALSPTIRRDRSRCSGAWARCASSTWASSGGAVETYRQDPRSSSPEHRGDDRGAGAHPARAREHELDGRELLEPIYKIRGDWPRLIGVVRGRGAPRRRSRGRRSRSYEQIADGYEVGLDDPAHAYEALGRGARARIRMNPEVQTSDRAPGARAAAAATIWSARYGQLVDVGRRSERKNALYHKIARSRGRPGRRRAGGGGLRRGRAGRVAARSRRPPTPSSSSICARGDYAEPGRAAAPQGGDRRRTSPRRRRSTTRPRSCTKRCWRTSRTPIERLPAGAVGRRRRPARRSISWSASTSGSARWDDLKDVYAKKAELATTPAEKKQMLFVLGPGLRPRA